MTIRNVINVSSVDLFVEDFAQRTDHPALKRWLTSNVRRWILKHYDRTDRVVLDPATGGYALADARGALRPLPDTVPDWGVAAIARGEEVMHLRLGATLRKRVSRALAALTVELDNGTLPSPDRIPFPKAEAKAKKQRHAAHVERRRARLTKAAIPVYRTVSGDTIVRLTTPESLADEGNRMGHCVATYAYWVKLGECEIYSLRTSDGKPRATVEVDCSGRVWQIKGFGNGPVAPAYRLALQSFIRSRGYPVDDDQDNLRFDERFAIDPKRLEEILVDSNALAWLRANRFASPTALRNVHFNMLLRAIGANARHLPKPILRDLFSALTPDDGPYLRVRQMASYLVYGRVVPLYYVGVPLPLLNQVRRRAFKGTVVAREANAVWHAVESAMARLALDKPYCLYALGRSRPLEPWQSDLLEYPADVLLRSQIDITPLRNARHQALRQAMNQAKYRCVGRRADPSGSHIAVRQLLDDSRRQYVL